MAYSAVLHMYGNIHSFQRLGPGYIWTLTDSCWYWKWYQENRPLGIWNWPEMDSFISYLNGHLWSSVIYRLHSIPHWTSRWPRMRIHQGCLLACSYSYCLPETPLKCNSPRKYITNVLGLLWARWCKPTPRPPQGSNATDWRVGKAVIDIRCCPLGLPVVGTLEAAPLPFSPLSTEETTQWWEPDSVWGAGPDKSNQWNPSPLGIIGSGIGTWPSALGMPRDVSGGGGFPGKCKKKKDHKSKKNLWFVRMTWKKEWGKTPTSWMTTSFPFLKRCGLAATKGGSKR